jgi:hypothetical protein
MHVTRNRRHATLTSQPQPRHFCARIASNVIAATNLTSIAIGKSPRNVDSGMGSEDQGGRDHPLKLGQIAR